MMNIKANYFICPFTQYSCKGMKCMLWIISNTDVTEGECSIVKLIRRFN
jgi:hypothetical protein